MTIALEEREDPPPVAPETVDGARRADPTDVGSGTGGDPPEEGEGGPGPRRGLPLWLAVTATVLLAALLTFLGTAHHMWSNLSGAHLPGA